MQFGFRSIYLGLAFACCLLAAGPGRALAAEKIPQGFEKQGLAFIKKHCVGCHGKTDAEADLSLVGYEDGMSVVRGRKTFEAVLTMVRDGVMPPEGKPQPSLEEREAFIRSVEAVFGWADKHAPADPGRITMRRLNRNEYNNTVRDLMWVDFEPAGDFPADDIGHGFDNIADVLTISPVLMERYLAAAEAIADRAILVDPPKPPSRWQGGKYLEPSQQDAPKWRPLTKDMLHTPWKLSLPGQYVMKARVWAKQTDDQPVKVSFLVNGTKFKDFEVTAPEKKPIELVAECTLEAGAARCQIQIDNPSDGDEKRALMVEYISLHGPADTRPPSQFKLLAASPDKPQAEQTREVLSRFALRAYRRPPRSDEVDRLVQLAESVIQSGQKWEAGIKFAMQAALVSPKFLFRVELDDRPVGAEPAALDEYQLASRLSYFVWATMPDDELFDLAAKGQLSANLEPQVRRMLADPRAETLVHNFGMQWLQIKRLETFQPDSKLFPSFNDGLRKSMLKESELFLTTIIREDRSVLDLVDANFTFLNEPLARHYGIVDTKGNRNGQKNKVPGGQPIRGREFIRVELQPESPRGGILTQASVLTVTSNPTRTSPVKRGRWVLEQILGTPPPPPPPNVPELEEQQGELTGSLRQRMEQHRSNPSCASCHARMDPLGFAFENFTAIGAWRDKDGEFAIDPSGELPGGQTFQGPQELKAILKSKRDLIATAITEKLLIYALGRGLEYYDQPAVDRITAAMAADNDKFSRLVIEIAKSDPFRKRRAKDTAP